MCSPGNIIMVEPVLTATCIERLPEVIVVCTTHLETLYFKRHLLKIASFKNINTTIIFHVHTNKTTLNTSYMYASTMRSKDTLLQHSVTVHKHNSEFLGTGYSESDNHKKYMRQIIWEQSNTHAMLNTSSLYV